MSNDFNVIESVSGTNQKSVVEMLPSFSDMLAFYQVYPDCFIDYILPPDSSFKLYPFQRVYLRIMARYKKVYITATRGTSKSFLNILSMYLKCIFFPNIKLSVVAPQKDQASQITQQNVEAIWNFMPVLKNEIKKIIFAKDYTRLLFHNNSVLDVVVASQGSRGLRRHGLSFEEICQMDKQREIIGEVLLPLLANNRKGVDGKVNPNEIHKQLQYITTSSSRQSYAWEQLYAVMCEMAKGKSAFVIGNDYTLPVMFDQLDQSYIDEVRDDPSMSPLQFQREYESSWTGSSENSLVQLSDLEMSRVLKKSENQHNRGVHDYIVSCDVARAEGKANATTAIAVFKIKDKGNGLYVKNLIHIETYRPTATRSMHFKDQALYLKELVMKYRAKMLVVDSNGLGKGLLDFLVIEDEYPPFSVINDDKYDRYKTAQSIPMIFSISSNKAETSASDIHNNFMKVIKARELNMLVSEQVIRENYKGKDMEELSKMILPHLETSYFIDEVMNLAYEERNGKTAVKQISRSMDKDRYSAISYGLYYIHLEERKNQERKRQTIGSSTSFMKIRKPNYKVKSWNKGRGG